METIQIIWFIILIILLFIKIFENLFKQNNFDIEKIKQLFNDFINIQKEDNFKFKDEISERINEKFEKLFKENKLIEKGLKEWVESTISKFLNDTITKINNTLDNIKNSLSEKFDNLNKSTKEKLDIISNRVDDRLENWFKNTQEVFKNLLEKMAKIDEAQKNIDKISGQIVWLQNVLTNNKTRWIFWEIQLEQILKKVFWENSWLYKSQFKMNDWTICDFVVETAQWLIPIDAKFSLSYYEKMFDENSSEEKRNQAHKDFKSALKRQIDETSKYIQNWTILSAFMFVPAEAIFSQIHAYHRDILDYAYTKKVNIVWPSSIIAMLWIIFLNIKSLETRKNAIQIQIYLKWLWDEFKRFRIRWDDFTNHYKKVTDDIWKIDTSAKKIITKFDDVQELRFENLNNNTDSVKLE